MSFNFVSHDSRDYQTARIGRDEQNIVMSRTKAESGQQYNWKLKLVIHM
jgi:hypothetical protein